MGRTFERIEEWEVYVPDIGDEREAFEREPEKALSAELRFLSRADVQKYDRMMHGVRNLSQIPKMAEAAAKALFVENVRNVQNYAPNGVALITGEDLWTEGEDVVVNDIAAALRDRARLDEGLGKKLRSRCASSSARRQSNDDGAALPVTQPSILTTPEIPGPTTQS